MASMILGLDPGVTTGWAGLLESGAIVGTGIVKPDSLEVTLDEIIRRVHRADHDVEAVVEEFPLAPAGQLAQDLREVVATVNRVLHTYGISPFRVLPGQWKTSAVGIAPILVNGQAIRCSTHEKDAIRMAKYYLSRRST